MLPKVEKEEPKGFGGGKECSGGSVEGAGGGRKSPGALSGKDDGAVDLEDPTLPECELTWDGWGWG